ncbi:hypothetical protein G5S52_21685 [Grimontia sp. S25]|uniref:VanZ-like domain-containing protein n=1 Tax=Grimontia sedimenti TaxID=2711294 RepID=A0A6M1RIJ0_9GAMM|nr:hypothetical protein [Grimontia sedimenti]NGO00141.1 hypothetical protein [Grimontia sedimenti]
MLSIDSTAYLWGHGDLVAHLLLFSLAAWMMLPFRFRGYLWLLLICVGVLSEVVQGWWLVGREGSVLDAITNIAGVLVVIGCCYARERRKVSQAVETP